MYLRHVALAGSVTDIVIFFNATTLLYQKREEIEPLNEYFMEATL
jgi:hypothetical protein